MGIVRLTGNDVYHRDGSPMSRDESRHCRFYSEHVRHDGFELRGLGLWLCAVVGHYFSGCLMGGVFGPSGCLGPRGAVGFFGI
jgi:hypothetical protein